jgi:FtsP/CotA-like multicopper oxidase with cupredoxin domain
MKEVTHITNPKEARMNKRYVFIFMSVLMALTVLTWAVRPAYAGPGVAPSTDIDGNPKLVPTYYANSPAGLRADPLGGPAIDTGTALRKFVDPFPGLCGSASTPTATGGGGTPLTNKCIPVAVPTKWTNPSGVLTNDDYYEIDLVQYAEPMHADLPATGTKLRGYVQRGVTQPHYLGPLIVANKNTPVRIKFCNLLPSGAGGNLFIPVDETLMGAGEGSLHSNGTNCDPAVEACAKYTQNRAELHLHGGDNPWISDGTPHQWTVPAAEYPNTPYQKGVSAQNVPDMLDPGPGCQTYYYPNGDSARLMFYHDHAAGVTRLNVYSGQKAGYLLKDAQDTALFGPSGTFPTLGGGTPLVIQEKTFVPKDVKLGNVPAVPVGSFAPAGPVGQDERWDTTVWGKYGDLWFPHVYETNQDPNSFDGTNPSGRWDWGPWFWPVFPAQFALPTGVPGDVTTTPEAFGDTPIVNGNAYPSASVQPKAYRFRVLNAANDRSWNLSFFVADPLTVAITNGGSGYSAATPPSVTIAPPASGTGASATAIVDPVTTAVIGISVTMGTGSYNTLTPPAVTIAPPASGVTATAYATAGTEVKMVAASPHPNCTGAVTTNCTCSGVYNPAGCYPPTWPTDGRDGGVPDPATKGPDIIQIGTEGGFLPAPAIIPAQPINYEYFRRSVTVLNVSDHALYLGPAERADIIVDFSAYAGKTLILYNDAPAPVPAFDARIDYYTDDVDQTANGGAPSTWAGYGPNTRTIMQIKVCGPLDAGCPAAAAAFVPSSLNAPLATAYAASQPKPVVPEMAYNAPWPGLTTKNTYAHIYTGAFYLGGYSGLTFTTPENITYRVAPTCTTATTCTPIVTSTALAGATISAYVEPKAIQELFEPVYGRMNATLGVELPFTTGLTQTTIPLGYIDPATETINDGETQFWKITHNGVDTHPVHFHLVNVQVLNRIGWDGTVKPPDANEVGWKETVRMNPLEDIVVAVRAKKPAVPFGVPISNRRMDPTQPIGSTMGFTQVDPATGNPAVVANALADYGWEYVWHCHILGHEENDFMRPFVLRVNSLAPAAPVLSGLGTPGSPINLTWTDATPAASSLGNPANEIGFRIERATGAGAFAAIGSVLANMTSYTDSTTVTGGVYRYRVVAYNAAGDGTSNIIQLPAVVIPPTIPTAPSGVTASAARLNTFSDRVTVSWTDNSNNETGFTVQRATNASFTSGLSNSTVGANITQLQVTTARGATYYYRVRANNAAGSSAWVNATPFPITTP